MITSQGVTLRQTIKASNIVAGKVYCQGHGMPAMRVLWIAPKFRMMREGSSMSLHRPARVVVDGKIVVGRFWFNQGYVEVKGE